MDKKLSRCGKCKVKWYCSTGYGGSKSIFLDLNKLFHQCVKEETGRENTRNGVENKQFFIIWGVRTRLVLTRR